MQCTTGENRWWECLVWDFGVHRADLDVKYWVRCTKLFTMNASFLVTQVFLHILVSYEGFRKENSMKVPEPSGHSLKFWWEMAKYCLYLHFYTEFCLLEPFITHLDMEEDPCDPQKVLNVKSLDSSVEEPNRTSSLSTTWAARQAGQLLASWSSSDPGDTI